MNDTEHEPSSGTNPAYIDVSRIEDLPPPPPGMRYLDFIGGNLNWRCFLVPEALPRARFMEDHSDKLDPCLAPIYAADGMRVRQDASYALPGFYILSFEEHYRSLDAIMPTLFGKAMFLCHRIRSLMRSQLGIEYIHLHYEEKPSSSCNVHFWIMPIAENENGDIEIIFDLNIRKYLSSFNFIDQRNNILRYNEAMRLLLR